MNIPQLYLDILRLGLKENEFKKKLLDLRKNDKESYFGPQGAALVKKLVEIGLTNAKKTKELKKLYQSEVKDYSSMEELDQVARFRSVKEIKKGDEQIETVTEVS